MIALCNIFSRESHGRALLRFWRKLSIETDASDWSAEEDKLKSKTNALMHAHGEPFSTLCSLSNPHQKEAAVLGLVHCYLSQQTRRVGFEGIFVLVTPIRGICLDAELPRDPKKRKTISLMDRSLGLEPREQTQIQNKRVDTGTWRAILNAALLERPPPKRSTVLGLVRCYLSQQTRRF